MGFAMVILRGMWAIVFFSNFSQCFGRTRRPSSCSRLYSGVEGNGVSWPKTGKPGGQVRIVLNPFCHPRCVVIHTNDERSDREDLSLSKTIEDACVFFGLVKSLLYIREVNGVDRLHPDKDDLTAGFRNQID